MDDHPVALGGLRSIPMTYPDIQIIDEVRSGKKLLELLIQGEKPDIVFLDLMMPDMDGFDVMKMIKKTYPSIKVIMFSSYTDLYFMAETIIEGADAYLSKGEDFEVIAETIFKVHENGFHYNQVISDQIEEIHKRWPARKKLTEKEIEIIRLIAKGFMYKEIAAKLQRSIYVINFHRKNITLKTGCKSNVELALYAKAHGLTSPTEKGHNR